jgi:type III secretory pathway component EscS
MAENQSLLGSGWSRVMHNKRYIVWFYVLNLVFAMFGAATFFNQTHDFLDHSMLSEQLVKGLDMGVLIEMFGRPEFPPVHGATSSGLHFAFAFLLLTALFIPGVLQGFASTYRLPREDFFRACGRNLWRFVRLMIIAAILMGVVAGALLGLQAALVKAAGESTSEMLPFEIRMLMLLVLFLVMTTLRIWFDLAQTDVVLSDQRAVRRSIGLGFRHTWRNLGRLVSNYVAAAVLAAIILAAGLLAWMKFVPSTSVAGAFIVTQLTLLLLLIPRFWQRGIAVSYYLQNMVEPITVHPVIPTPIIALTTPQVAISNSPA